jgi:putative hemolysin
MLIGIFFIGIALFFICGLVALEVALLESKRAFVPQPNTLADGTPSSPSDTEGDGAISVADFIAAARIAISGLLLAIGAIAVLTFSSTELGLIRGVPGTLAELFTSLLAIVVVAVAAISAGFVIPSYIGTRFREATLRYLSPLGRSIVGIVWPAITMVRLMRRIGVTKEGGATVEEEAIEEDIKSLVEEGERAGVIEEEEREMISRVFRLGDKPIASIMTSRSDVVFLDVGMTVAQAVEKALESRLSWFPVRHGVDDEVVGIVSVHDVFELRSPDADRSVARLKEVSSPAMDVPESMTALELLERFKEQGERFAVVRDEYGSVSGIVTVDDVLQVVVGDMSELNGEEKSVTTRDDGSLLVDASLDVQSLFETIGCAQTPEDDQGQFHSVGGFVMTSLGRIPKEGDSFIYDGHRFEVVDMDGKRIDKVLISRIAGQRVIGV